MLGLSVSRKVLIIDVNVDVALALAVLLRAHDYDVKVEFSGSNGLETAHSWFPDVVVLDLGMTTMDSYELAAKLRRTPGLHDVYLILLSNGFGHTGPSSDEFRFDVCLTKPTGCRNLVGILGRYFSK